MKEIYIERDREIMKEIYIEREKMKSRLIAGEKGLIEREKEKMKRR